MTCASAGAGASDSVGARGSVGAQGHIEQPSGHEGCCEVGVTHCGCGGTGSSTTQQICPGLQQDTPQHVWLPVHAAPPSGSQGGVAQLPPMQVGVEAGQTCPQEPQLNGSSCVSRQRP